MSPGRTIWQAAAPLPEGSAAVGGPGAAPPRRRDRYDVVGGAQDLAGGDAALVFSGLWPPMWLANSATAMRRK